VVDAEHRLSVFLTGGRKRASGAARAVDNFVDMAREGAYLLAACQAQKIGLGRKSMKKPAWIQ
jgi:hypothetical protein